MRCLIHPILLAAVLLPLMCRAEAYTDDVINPSQVWQNVQDYEESIAFEFIGPPDKENARRTLDETELYLDMIVNYDDISDEEDDFMFVAEAYSVPTSQFRPTSLRPVQDGGDDDLFDDDPLPVQTKTTSIYVDTIRQSFLPGPLIKARNLDDVVLGNNRAHPLFESIDKTKEKPKPKEEPKVVAKPKPEQSEATESASNSQVPSASPRTNYAAQAQSAPVFIPKPLPKNPNAANSFMKAGRINGPAQQEQLAKEAQQAISAAGGNGVIQQSRPMTPDEETLVALQQAVRELGLEKELNFEGSPFGSQTLAQGVKKLAEKEKVQGEMQKSAPSKTETMKTENTETLSAIQKPVQAVPAASAERAKPIKKKRKRVKRIVPAAEAPAPEPVKKEEDSSWF